MAALKKMRGKKTGEEEEGRNGGRGRGRGWNGGEEGVEKEGGDLVTLVEEACRDGSARNGRVRRGTMMTSQ